MGLKQLGEFGLISLLTRQLPPVSRGVIVGIGDDAAVLQPSSGKYLVVSSDMMVEDVHFVRDKIDPYALGHKLLASSLSDMAAMAASPRYALVSLALPDTVEPDWLTRIYTGLGDLARRFDVSIVGGDTTRSPGSLVLDLTLLGEAEPNAYRTRAAAKIGDLLVVTGSLGGAAAGLTLELAESVPLGSDCWRDRALRAHYYPEPRVSIALAWAQQGLVHALNDISDGLVSEVCEICQASDVGARLFAEKVPIAKEAAEVGRLLGRDPLELALFGGEDYELVATLPESQLRQVEAIACEEGIPLQVVGEISPARDGVVLLNRGKTSRLNKAGFNHFR